jgi:hypothetical protein
MEFIDQLNNQQLHKEIAQQGLNRIKLVTSELNIFRYSNISSF